MDFCIPGLWDRDSCGGDKVVIFVFVFYEFVAVRAILW